MKTLFHTFLSQFLAVHYLKVIATVQHAYRVEFCLLSISECFFNYIFQSTGSKFETSNNLLNNK